MNLQELEVKIAEADKAVYLLRAPQVRLNQTIEDVKLNASYDKNGRYRGVRVRRDLRLAIYLRDRMRCLYCNVDLLRTPRTGINLDHLSTASETMQSNGAMDNTPTNLITTCEHCNKSRKNKPWEVFASENAAELIEQRRYTSIRRLRKLAKAMIERSIW